MQPGYLSPFIAEMSVVSNFTIDSQVSPNTLLPILLPVVFFPS